MLKFIKFIFVSSLLFPGSLVALDNIFLDPDDENANLKEESGGLLGSDQLPLNKTGKWERLKPLEAYGQSSVEAPKDPNEAYQQEKATRQYLQARDPFSNYERIENVRDTLSPRIQ
jgi:hypothetical protein